MEDNIFILSDASYSSKTKIAGLGVIDTFREKKYKLSVININSIQQAEFFALALSIKIAICNKYSNVVFVYDCKELKIDSLVEYANKKIKNVQFLWLKRNYLNEVDSLAKSARKLIEKLNIKKALAEDLKKIENKYILEERKRIFMSFPTKQKIMAVVYIANEREYEILNGFLSFSLIDTSLEKGLGSKKGTFLKFVYTILVGDDKVSFLNYILYVKPSLNKKIFKRGLVLNQVNNYLNEIFRKLKRSKKNNI